MYENDQHVRRAALKLIALRLALSIALGVTAPVGYAIAGPHDEVVDRYSPVPASSDGIGKLYMGREISAVMGWQGAAWLEREEREREERTDLLVAALALQPGMVVADIGAGADTPAPHVAIAWPISSESCGRALNSPRNCSGVLIIALSSGISEESVGIPFAPGSSRSLTVIS